VKKSQKGNKIFLVILSLPPLVPSSLLHNRDLAKPQSACLPVPHLPNLLNSARYYRVFQNFVVPWKIHMSQELILPADVSRQDAPNGVRVAYVNFYNMWVKNMVKDSVLVTKYP